MEFTKEQQEYIEKYYLRCPLDADGVPIRVGDMLEYDYGDIKGKHLVSALIYDDSRDMDLDGGIWDFEFADDVEGYGTRTVNCMSNFYKCNRHVQPRTLEDVLRDYACDFADSSGPEYDEEITKRYAEEIRELLKVER